MVKIGHLLVKSFYQVLTIFYQVFTHGGLCGAQEWSKPGQNWVVTGHGGKNLVKTKTWSWQKLGENWSFGFYQNTNHRLRGGQNMVKNGGNFLPGFCQKPVFGQNWVKT